MLTHHGPPALGPVVRYGSDPTDLGVCLAWACGSEEVWWGDGAADTIAQRRPHAVRRVEGQDASALVVTRSRRACVAQLPVFGLAAPNPHTVAVLRLAAHLHVYGDPHEAC